MMALMLVHVPLPIESAAPPARSSDPAETPGVGDSSLSGLWEQAAMTTPPAQARKEKVAVREDCGLLLWLVAVGCLGRLENGSVVPRHELHEARVKPEVSAVHRLACTTIFSSSPRVTHGKGAREVHQRPARPIPGSTSIRKARLAVEIANRARSRPGSVRCSRISACAAARRPRSGADACARPEATP
jgi:hypothetical protein